MAIFELSQEQPTLDQVKESVIMTLLSKQLSVVIQDMLDNKNKGLKELLNVK